MKYYIPGAVSILLCAAANPAWSGVPHFQQRAVGQPVASPASTAMNDCLRVASVEKDIASLKFSISEMLERLKTLSVAGK